MKTKTKIEKRTVLEASPCHVGVACRMTLRDDDVILIASDEAALKRAWAAIFRGETVSPLNIDRCDEFAAFRLNSTQTEEVKS